MKISRRTFCITYNSKENKSTQVFAVGCLGSLVLHTRTGMRRGLELELLSFLQKIVSYLSCMDKKCRITSSCAVCFSQCVAIGRFDLTMIRWSIFSNKIWNSYYTSGTSWTCNPVAPPIIPEGLKYKRSLWTFLKPLIACCYICGFVYVFLFFRSTVGQTLNYCGHCIEVWCVPSATCGSWLYLNLNTVLSIGVFVGLLFKIYGM